LNLIAENLEKLTDCDVKLGGKGIFVEVDETKVAKRKYYREHRGAGTG
jgi:hypothetical protein